MRVQLKLILGLCLIAAVGCKDSGTSMGGDSKKQEKQVEPAVEGNSNDANIVQTPQGEPAPPSPSETPPEVPGLPGGEVADESADESEFAESPTNILGTFLTVNRIAREDDGKTIRLGLTVVDSSGNKVGKLFGLSYDFAENLDPDVTTDFVELPLDRAYHAIGLIKAPDVAKAERASEVIHFSASSDVAGQKVTSRTSGSTAVDGTRLNDPGDYVPNSIPVPD